jgi:hypothetical protein
MMSNSKLARKARKQARREYRKGNIDRETYDHVLKASRDEQTLEEWNQRIYSAQLNPWDHTGVLYGSLVGFDFSNIWDWFQENWPAILQMLLTILPLFLGDDE